MLLSEANGRVAGTFPGVKYVPRAKVRVTQSWDEPLVLRLAAMGEPSTGKSAALALVMKQLTLKDTSTALPLRMKHPAPIETPE
jgi:hypothetical protein